MPKTKSPKPDPNKTVRDRNEEIRKELDDYPVPEQLKPPTPADQDVDTQSDS